MIRRLIALDLDDTLLDSRKQIPEEAVCAVRKADRAGKTVVFNTGRAVSELDEYTGLLPEVRYAIYASGAGLFDLREKKTACLRPIPEAQQAEIRSLARTRDVMLQLVLGETVVIQASHMANLEHYHMGVFRSLYEKSMTLVPDILAFAESCREPVLKMNLYHAAAGERIASRARLEASGLQMAFASESSLECSAPGVNKGSGLVQLCSLLGVAPEESVAVGDADNDIPALQAAGLGVAMGNAPAHVKAAADRIVSDQDHGGCAEAIMMLFDE